jgi:hypothetical protein
MSEQKPIHVKPSFYAYVFEEAKEVALKYGYNLVLHGSLNRDLDMIAVPWNAELGSHEEMIEELITVVGGSLMYGNGVDRHRAKDTKHEGHEDFPKGQTTHHGRIQYVINLNREGFYRNGEHQHHQYYLDISIIPPAGEKEEQDHDRSA